MGLKKYNVMGLFDKSPVVTAKSIARFVPNKYYKQLIKNLLDKGKIYRITKGKYSRHNDPSLFVFTVAPAYLGLQDAMSAHGIWKQETTPVIITCRKIRPGNRNTLDSNILVRRIDRKYLFGYGFIDFGKYHLPYSDLEKTFIDMAYYDEHMDKEALQRFRSRIEGKKLNTYLKSYPKRIKAKCLSLLNE